MSSSYAGSYTVRSSDGSTTTIYPPENAISFLQRSMIFVIDNYGGKIDEKDVLIPFQSLNVSSKELLWGKLINCFRTTRTFTQFQKGILVKKEKIVKTLEDGTVEVLFYKINILPTTETGVGNVIVIICNEMRKLESLNGIVSRAPSNSYELKQMPIYVFDTKLGQIPGIIRFAYLEDWSKDIVARICTASLLDGEMGEMGKIDITESEAKDADVLTTLTYTKRFQDDKTIIAVSGLTKKSYGFEIYVCTEENMKAFGDTKKKTFWEYETGPKYSLISKESQSSTLNLKPLDDSEISHRKLETSLQICSEKEKEAIFVAILKTNYDSIVDSINMLREKYKTMSETGIFQIGEPDIKELQDLCTILLVKILRMGGIPGLYPKSASEPKSVPFQLFERLRANIESLVHTINEKLQTGQFSVVGINDAMFFRPIDFPTAFCSYCGKPKEEGKSLLLCSKCTKIQYCCKQCQKNDWKRHKKECSTTLTAGSRFRKRKRKQTNKNRRKKLSKRLSRRNII